MTATPRQAIEDALRTFASDELEPRLPVGGEEHAEAVAAEVHGDQVRDVVIVLDHHERLFTDGHVIKPATGEREPAATVRKV